MTTQREINRWTEPILRARSDLGLGRGCLVLKPVHHLLRGLYIWPNRNKDLPKIGWFFLPLFSWPMRSIGVTWSFNFHIGVSHSDGFVERLARVTEDALGVLSPIASIEDFFIETTVNPHGRKLFMGYWELSRYPSEYGPVLASLGRLRQAREVLVPWMAKEEQTGLAEIAEGQALLAKRTNSGIGKDKLRWGEGRLGVVARLKHLAELAAAGDRAGIGALLREWEQVSVKTWGVEHLYEPTPFPVEQGAGD